MFWKFVPCPRPFGHPPAPLARDIRACMRMPPTTGEREKSNASLRSSSQSIPLIFTPFALTHLQPAPSTTKLRGFLPAFFFRVPRTVAPAFVPCPLPRAAQPSYPPPPFLPLAASPAVLLVFSEDRLIVSTHQTHITRATYACRQACVHFILPFYMFCFFDSPFHTTQRRGVLLLLVRS